MSRGSLIFPMRAVISRVDTLGTSTGGDPGNPGYDFDFKEPKKYEDGSTSLVYLPAVTVPCQVETENIIYDRLAMAAMGDEGDTSVSVLFHFRSLEEAGLVTTQGRASMHKGDRLDAVLDRDGHILDDYAERNIVVIGTDPLSYGLSSRTRNLLLVHFRTRDRGTREV